MSSVKITDYFPAKKNGHENFLTKNKHQSTTVNEIKDGEFKKPNENVLFKQKSKLNKHKLLDGQRDIRDSFKVINQTLLCTEKINFDEFNDDHLNEDNGNDNLTPKRKVSPLSVFSLPDFKRKRNDDDFKINNQYPQTVRSNCKISFELRKTARKITFEDDVKEKVDTIKTEQVSIDTKSETENNGSKLTVAQVKSRLANCSKLSELRQRLVNINDCAAKLRDFKKRTNSPIKTDFNGNLDIKVDTKKSENVLSPKKYLSSKISPKKETTCERFAHLAETTNESNLVLPFKYRTLLEAFRCCDTVVSMLHNRKEVCTFDKLKKSIEEMMKKVFDLKRLSQIVTINPKAYHINYEKIFDMKTKAFKIVMIIIPVLSSIYEKMSPSLLIERRENFRNQLLNKVKESHKEFLQSLNPPIHIDNQSLQRWHPNFKIEDMPDIECDKLILDNTPDETKSKTSSSVLEQFSSKLKEECEKEEKIESPKVNLENKIKSGVLKGVSTALLLKIRAKEALSMQKDLTRKPEVEKRLHLIEKLPETIKIIHNYFISDRCRAAIGLQEMIKKCSESLQLSTSLVELEEQLKLLAELLPNWFFILTVTRGQFVKIDKDQSLKELYERLEKIKKQIRDQ